MDGAKKRAESIPVNEISCGSDLHAHAVLQSGPPQSDASVG
jgi:hypothetical protein